MPAQAALKFYPQSTAVNPAQSGGGACATDTDPELFFREDELGVQVAKKICAACPMAAACLNYALENEEFGIWGGKTPEERDELRGEPLNLELRKRSVEAERLLNAGLTVKQIADYFAVVERTVYRYKADRAEYLAAQQERAA